MMEDTIQEVIKDAHNMALHCADAAPDLLKWCFESIATRLERVCASGLYITPEAAEEPALKIGCQPAVYKKGDGLFTAIAHGNQTTYIMDVKPFRDRVIGQFLIDGEKKLIMMGATFHRVIGCLASASNAYIRMNQHAKERKRRCRAAKKEAV